MKVGVLFPSRFGDAGEFLADARAMEAAGVDSVWLDNTADGLDPVAILAAIAAVTTVLRLGLVDRHREPVRRIETLNQLSRHRVVDPAEPWRRVQLPADRDEWAQALQAAERDGVGVLVPMDPRLLDVLRHPDDAIDRSDVVLAQG
jgi:Luciferase-like monooxygenase